MMNLSLLYFLAGLIGSALRAASTYSHDTWNPKSITDIVVGGVLGILYPLAGALPSDPWQAAALICGLSYVGSSVLQGVLGRIGTAAKIPALVSAFGPQAKAEPKA